MPEVLRAARRYADRCLAGLPPVDEDADEAEEPDALTEVDGRQIPREEFRAHLGEDRPGGCALAYLAQWVLPTVAALTRDRAMLTRAMDDRDLVAAAAAMRDSEAYWLDVLLAAQMRCEWLVLFPAVHRGFRVLLDGIVRNFDLHALLAGALVGHGVPGTANPPELLAYVCGETGAPPRDWVEGTWNLYDFRAARFDLSTEVPPLEFWVWGEGAPRDVPPVDGVRTLLVGPASMERSWSAGRPFSALPSSVRISSELSRDEVADSMARLVAAAG